jgi:hypothetical protein
MGGTPKKPPATSGKAGDYTTSSANGPGGKAKVKYWYHNGTDWEATTEANYNAKKVQEPAITLGTISPKSNMSSDGALRYPRPGAGENGMDANSDYVLFEFYEYQPPFGAQRKAGEKGLYDYNQANEYELLSDYKPIVMYMPEDISSGFRAQWGGKKISNVASGLLRAAGQNGLADKAAVTGDTAYKALEKMSTMAGMAAIQKLVTTVTGDTLSNDDIFGGISGAILNPNTELLFGGTDMRNFQLNFKLVPRHQEEATDINEIVKTFQKAMLPSDTPGQVFGQFAAKNPAIQAGFIKVPKLCKVTYMHGSEEHTRLPKYKMCAIVSVDVNYTPDGAYATYADTQPVAISLALNFQETKMVFSEEIESGAVR